MMPNQDVVDNNVKQIRARLESYEWREAGDFTILSTKGRYPGFLERFEYTGSGELCMKRPGNNSQGKSYEGSYVLVPFDHGRDSNLLVIIEESFEEGSPKIALTNLRATRRSYNMEARRNASSGEGMNNERKAA